MNRGISQDLKQYFWDVDFSKLDFDKKSEFVIERILEYGDPEAVKWLFDNYNRDEIKKVLKNKRGFSKKTANFWSKILEVDQSEIQCLKKSYRETQKTHWPY